MDVSKLYLNIKKSEHEKNVVLVACILFICLYNCLFVILWTASASSLFNIGSPTPCAIRGQRSGLPGSVVKYMGLDQSEGRPVKSLLGTALTLAM